MPQANHMTTQEIINSVYEWVGNPSKAVLKPTTVCVKFWTILGKRQLELEITDRTIYLSSLPLAVAQNALEVGFGEEPFTDVLALERVVIEGGIEQKVEIPVIGDARDANQIPELVAWVYRGTDGVRTLRFNRPFPENASLRAWVQPSLAARPGREERPMMPVEAANYLVLDTAEACLPEIRRAFGNEDYAAFMTSVSKQKFEYKQIYDQWRMKSKATGKRKRTPYREQSRRGGRVYFDYGGEG